MKSPLDGLKLLKTSQDCGFSKLFLEAMSFWGCIVAPGQSKKVETRAGELLHLSQEGFSRPF